MKIKYSLSLLMILTVLLPGTTLAGNVSTQLLWPIRPIHVCFENFHDHPSTFFTNKQWRKWVQEGAEKWQKHSYASFIGWDSCKESSGGLRIKGIPYDWSTSLNKTGIELDGVKNGIQITSRFKLKDITANFNARATITSEATTKFGQALGFNFEYRHALDSKCFPPSRESDITLGTPDPKSNLYCNDIQLYRTRSKELSESDKRMVSFFYRNRYSLEIPEGGIPRYVGDRMLATDQFTGTWSSSKYIRTTAEINGDGIPDLIGFGDRDVYSALGNGDGSFATAQKAARGFGIERGWNKAQHVRTLADVNGDGKDDIVAFGDPGVFTALSLGNGHFARAKLAIKSYSASTGGWHKNKHTRRLADINGDGRADIVGFGDQAVYTSLARADGTFAKAKLAVNNYGSQVSRPQTFFRQLGDINGDGLADIIVMTNSDIYASLSLGNGRFAPKALINTTSRSSHYTPHRADKLVDINSDGLADILDVSDDEIIVYFSNGNGRFTESSQSFSHFFRPYYNFVYESTIDLADVNGDGLLDLVGVTRDGVFASINQPNGPYFQPAKKVLNKYSYGGQWTKPEGWEVIQQVIFTDLNGDGAADILAFDKDRVDAGFFEL